MSQPDAPAVPLVPLPAATVTLVRDSVSGPEVLMMQRNLKSKFVPGAYIFPGGALDAEDDAPALRLAREGGHHAPRALAGGHEGAGEVDVQHPLEFRDLDVGGQADAVHAGVSDYAVDRT